MKKNTKPPSKSIDNETAQKLVKDLMQVIKGEKDVKLLEARVEKMPFGKAILEKRPGKNYPPIRFQISKNEIADLMGLEVLDQNGALAKGLAEGTLKNGQPMTSLEKLLYSVFWKNGDLGKERHIVSGVLEDAQPQKTGVVFYEFGGYLSGRNNFILDQHTLRCFAVAQADESDIEQARRLEGIDGSNPFHSALREQYKAFYKAIEQEAGGQLREYAIEVDRLFFGAGKLIKLGKNGSRTSKAEM